MENKKMKIGAVVVTYNRLDKLKKALESFEKQLYLPAYVIVADNAAQMELRSICGSGKRKMQALKRSF